MSEFNKTPENFNPERQDDEKVSGIEYDLKEPPEWYIQGSYVLDKIFGKTTAQDIDIL